MRTLKATVLALFTALLVGADSTNGTRTTAPPQAGATATPRDQAIQLLADANQAYRGIKDYSCMFIKRERLRGKLGPDNMIDMKVRTQPFCIYMRWLGPKEFEGQQACYNAGRNGNMLRARGTGFSGIAGFVSLDLRDPRVMENNRHTINEAGIGNLLTRLGQRWEASLRTNTTNFQIAEYTYNHRPCFRVDTVHTTHLRGGADDYHRTVVYFDRENRLPIRVENYDWPKPGGDPNGDLLESYSYVNLQTNVGLKDNVFNH